jgi:hypothetical protein
MLDEKNIKNRLRTYAEISDMQGFNSEATCAYDAIEYIKQLENFVMHNLPELQIEMGA